LWPGRTDSHNNNNIHICIAPYGRNFRGAGESDMNHPVNLIWAVCGEYAPHSTVLTINHFVPLIALPIEGNTDDRQGQARAADMDESVEDGDAQDVSQESETPLPVATVTADGADKFWDDCGAWSQHHGWKSYHLRKNLMEVHLLDDGSYSSRRRVEGKRVNIIAIQTFYGCQRNSRKKFYRYCVG